MNTKYDYICLNFWTSLNYGAVLTAYATQSILEKLGYSSAHIDYKYKHVKKSYDGSFTDKFAKKYLTTTNECRTYTDFVKLNSQAKYGFIVGSDQVFRDDYIKKTYGMYLLAFANPEKLRVAISASFGKDSFKYKSWKKYFKAFDAISVRESNAVQICNQLDVNAVHILDPVFIADKKIFDDLADSVSTPDNLAVGYILDKENENRVKSLIDSYGENFINLANSNLSVEEFLAYIKNSKLFITDSFHGTCFALIFNKKFLTISNENRGNSRFESLFKTFELGYDNLDTPTDWDKINQIISIQREKGLDFLKNALNTSTKHKKIKFLTNISARFRFLFR